MFMYKYYQIFDTMAPTALIRGNSLLETIPSQARDASLEGVETTGGTGILNNQHEQAAQHCEDIVQSWWRHQVQNAGSVQERWGKH